MFDHLSASYTGGAGLAADLAVTTAVAGGELAALVTATTQAVPTHRTAYLGINGRIITILPAVTGTSSISTWGPSWP